MSSNDIRGQPAWDDGIFGGTGDCEAEDTVIPLSNIEIKNAKNGLKPVKLADGGGLYVLVTMQGSKLWRLDYRFAGRRKTLSMGKYPEVSLVDARELREAARKALRGGVDPSRRRQEKAEALLNTFSAVAKRWFEARKAGWVPAYQSRVWSRIENDIEPAIGLLPIDKVEPDEILSALRIIERRGAVETARRVRNYVQDIFRYAKSERLVKVNPADDLADALATPPPSKRRTALKARDLPEFLVALERYDGEVLTRLAIKLTLLTFVRTGEARFARWSEFENLDGRSPIWRISAERMKMRNEHLVPLAPQAVAALKAIRALQLKGDQLFPAATRSGVMSENTMLFALYRMGYHQRATIHGFRGMASTILNENGFNRDWIERQLAHVERDQVRAAYNAAEWLPQRREMMTWWAEYLDHALAQKTGHGAVPSTSPQRRKVRSPRQAVATSG